MYIHWRSAKELYKCYLVCAKTKVALKLVTTVPRMELMLSQISVHLAATVVKSMKDFEFEDNVFLTDSTAVCSMIQAESSSLLTFTGLRIAEVKAASEDSR